MTTDPQSLLGAVGDAGAFLDAIFKQPGVSDLLGTANLVLLALGTAWLSYNIIAGIAQSAWDGELWGKRFHSLWMPIRMAIGIAALIPVLDGWSTAQVVMYQVAKMGAGAANLAIATAAPKFANDQIVPGGFTRTGLAQQMFSTLLCRARVQLLARDTAGLVEGGDWERYYEINRCGGSPVIPQGELREAHFAATQALINTLTPLSARVAAGQEGRGAAVPPAEVAAAVSGAAASYETAIAEAARGLASAKSSALNAQSSAAGNWLTFGFQTVKAARAQADVTAAAAAAPQLSANSNTTQGGREAAGYTGSMEMEGFTGPAAEGAGAGAGGGLWDKFMALKDNPALFLKILFSSTKAPTLADGGLVQSLAAFGSSLITMAWTAAGALLVAFAGLALTSFLGAGAIPLALWVGGIALGIIIPMVVLGVTLSVYVPLVPALFWTLGIVAWLLVVAECIFMAPIWALAHLEAEGEGMGQRTEKGYAMLLDLLLRPLALVFAFAIAGAILNGAWTLFTSAVGGLLELGEPNFITKFILWLGAVFVVTTLAVQLVGTVYRKALDLPDQAVQWIGSSVTSYLGDHSTKDPVDGLKGAGRGGGRPPTGKGDKGGADAPVAPAAPSGAGK